MPYLHYEKRCDQAKIHEIIKETKNRATWEQKTRQGNNQAKEDGSTSSQLDSDDDRTTTGDTSCEPLEPAPSLKPVADRCFSQETQTLLAEDEEKSRFLNAEAALVKGYLNCQEKLHVSILGHPLFPGFQSQRSRLEEHLISLTITY